MGLFEELGAIQRENWEFQIELHGGTVKDSKTSTAKTKSNTPLFGDPEDYKHMTEEERQTQTERMMGKHKKSKFF